MFAVLMLLSGCSGDDHIGVTPNLAEPSFSVVTTSNPVIASPEYEQEHHNYSVNYYKVSVYSNDIEPNSLLISSTDDLTEYCKRWRSELEGCGLYQKQDELLYDALLDNTKYGDDYFKDSCLLFIFIPEGSGSIKHEVTSVITEGGITTVNINRVLPEVGNTALALWNLLIELPTDIVDNTIIIHMRDTSI